MHKQSIIQHCMIHQFQRIFKFNFWRVFVTWLNVGAVHLALRHCLTRRRDFKGMLYVLRAEGTRGVFVPTPPYFGR